jgi:chorismate mutase
MEVSTMPVRGVRGATVSHADQTEAILAATRELLTAILNANPDLNPEDLTSVFFTMTGDLSATFPAEAARQLGWEAVPMLCAREIDVPGRLTRCIRVLLHWNTELPQRDVQHVYLGEATVLRPDLIST